MSKPLIAVIGRPNVGKSTFFNKVCGKRISIIKDTPGVTRDRIYGDAEWCGRAFTLIDTGGIDWQQDTITEAVRKQAEIAADISDLILFFTDGKAGVTAADHEIASFLRHTKKRVLLVVNKLDNFEVELTYDFYQLGLGDPIPVSCEQSKGLGDLLDEIVRDLPVVDGEEGGALKIALVGRPNVGKSSLVNKLLGFERVIVSDVAGTTRDAVDTPFSADGKDYILIDTAGLRRKRGIEYDTVESYSVMRSVAAIKRADVVLILFDASEGISEQDIRIAGLVHEEGKPSVILMNKWDKVEKDTFTIEKFKEKLDEDLKFMPYFETVYISALNGQRVNKLLPLVQKAYENASKRITTGTLNDVVRDAVSVSEPPASSGRRLKIMYCTQPDTNPPKFLFFVNDEQLVHFSYKRYLENALRRAFDFSMTPIKLIFAGKKEEN